MLCMVDARDAGVGNACDVIITALEAELQKAREMAALFEGDGHRRAARRAIRRFCAGLVETSVELSREFVSLTPSTHTD
jgi:hypothetical protein